MILQMAAIYLARFEEELKIFNPDVKIKVLFDSDTLNMLKKEAFEQNVSITDHPLGVFSIDTIMGVEVGEYERTK